MIDQGLDLFVEFAALLVPSSVVVIVDEALDAAIGSITWVVDIDESKLFDRCKAFPVSIESINLLFC